MHVRGEVLHTDHEDEGTRLRVRVDAELASELTPYLVTRRN
jgi:hypothetical protein